MVISPERIDPFAEGNLYFDIYLILQLCFWLGHCAKCCQRIQASAAYKMKIRLCYLESSLNI